jgi:hypothetical protein
VKIERQSHQVAENKGQFSEFGKATKLLKTNESVIESATNAVSPA